MLAAGAFHIGPWAAEADDRIIYNDQTGRLYFDLDGSAGRAERVLHFAGGTGFDEHGFHRDLRGSPTRSEAQLATLCRYRRCRNRLPSSLLAALVLFGEAAAVSLAGS